MSVSASEKTLGPASERFLRYVTVDTQSDEDQNTVPSTPGQKVLAGMLVSELKELGITNAALDEKSGTVYARIPPSEGRSNDKTLGFIAHMDTSPETSGKGVSPRIIENYDGGRIVLSREPGVVLDPVVYPELRNYTGKTIITTDGTTLLGADDKAGIAEIMTMAARLMSDISLPHGPVAIAFTPDEEIGAGIKHFDLERFGADYAYTVDGGAIGELEYECFNAASAKVRIRGVSIHTGEAKDKMINAARLAARFDSLIPAGERPEYTEGYQGFFHLENISASVEEASLEYLIRDHDSEGFLRRKELMESIAASVGEGLPEGTVSLEIKDTYRNMREKIFPDNMFLIDNAKACMERLGIQSIIKPIRGGTDGAFLSFKGLPCPNLCAGGHNFHGRYEYCCAESIEKISELLVLLADSALDRCAAEVKKN
ncbi:MAG: peptidase T [Ruminococcus sp.]|nr:peptidase T [Ruminococcus sp.]